MVNLSNPEPAKLVAEIERRDIGFVVMAARGTSDHAAICVDIKL